MSRVRRNRRKPEPLRLPALPKVRINWRALLLPPAAIAVLATVAEPVQGWLDRPVTELTVEGEFQRVRPVEIEAALGSVRSRRFFTLDLRELKQAVAAIDWVDTVEVKRIWPDRVHVRVTEHRAAASWGENGLLNTRGELFTANAKFDYAELPRLSGPPGSERRIAELYLELRSQLAGANLTLTALEMDERGAMSFTLGNGQRVRLGRNAQEQRLARFFEIAAPALAPDFDRVNYIDLRYPNGFAVGWDEPPDAEPVRMARADPDA